LSRAAFAALVGRPSAGKSTLLNALCGHKVSIVSPAPQTTRNAVRGILNRPEGQIVFIDTPGRHNSLKKFNKKLTEVSGKAMQDADIILYVLDASRAPGPEEAEIAAQAAPRAERSIAALSKQDARGADLERARAFIAEKIPALPVERVIPVSGLKREGLDALSAALFRLAPEGEPFYPADCYTDQELPFRVAEIIREQAMLRLREELPHAIYVETADLELRPGPAGETLWVRAFIVTERESQKGMVVGKGGAMIKKIRLAALAELRPLFDWHIDLDLRVKCSKDWRANDAVLRGMFRG
jgi:GTP-binding protein Era